MIKRVLAAILTFYWEFIKRHPLVSIFFSLILMAACAGGIYLIFKEFPTLMSMPCFRGGGCST